MKIMHKNIQTPNAHCVVYTVLTEVSQSRGEGVLHKVWVGVCNLGLKSLFLFKNKILFLPPPFIIKNLLLILA